MGHSRDDNRDRTDIRVNSEIVPVSMNREDITIPPGIMVDRKTEAKKGNIWEKAGHLETIRSQWVFGT